LFQAICRSQLPPPDDRRPLAEFLREITTWNNENTSKKDCGASIFEPQSFLLLEKRDVFRLGPLRNGFEKAGEISQALVGRDLRRIGRHLLGGLADETYKHLKRQLGGDGRHRAEAALASVKKMPIRKNIPHARSSQPSFLLILLILAA
jgi:hypothetical protein